MPERRGPLFVTILVAVGLLIAVSAWLLTDPATSRATSPRTGGLASGAVIALYALWLNDRRRRVEENRQRTERERHELELLRAERDRERVTDERFAKSVELLGHEADQVRVGALHALAGLARSNPEYTQTVLDVLCSYLRRPFPHPGYGDDTDEAEARREQQVRLAAQRQIQELLPPRGPEAVVYDLDLAGARLDRFHLKGRAVGRLYLQQAQLLHRTSFADAEFHGRVYLTALDSRGPITVAGAVFHQKVKLEGVHARHEVDFDGATFEAEVSIADGSFDGPVSFRDTRAAAVDLRRARFADHVDLRLAAEAVSLYNTEVDQAREVRLPAAWSLEPLAGGRARIRVGG
ncbi:pentapeptide repeat-containing protein [Amycolatopsis thermalba]|uniref:pentapeptide repeat-containing protein n=1 Tax=Amycolatopsis thermalba TaxID=944492 RepID=UPI000E22C018|nr:pentapeptide repeat-containing protein [Amycolatopsis thermalba]